MTLIYEQCYYLDSGLMVDQHSYDDAIVTESFTNRGWFDSGIHGITTYEITFPADWEKQTWFVVPGLNQIFGDRENGTRLHPYLRAIKTQFAQLDWESIEDKIEGAGGLRAAIAALDIGRLGRRVKALYLAGKITAAQALKIKAVFQHLTDQFD